jgi:RNA polymerase sigma-70 factor (ECF subfamily)
MEIAGISEQTRSAGWTDEEIVERVKSRDTALYAVVMRRDNQQLYRIARAILHDDGEAEDVMQAA